MTDERTALITGCGSGIGRATAEAFADRDWSVYATDVDDGSLGGLEAETFALDVTDDEACAAGVDRVLDDSGRLDCLVNNAGYAVPGPVEDVPVADARRQFDVLVHGPHRLVREALPALRESEGTVVTVTSVLGRSAFPGAGIYCAAKFAARGLTDALRMECDDVDVVAVEPAWVDTAFEAAATERLADLDRSDVYDDVYRLYENGAALDGGPLAVSPDDVAATIVEAATAADPLSHYPVGPVAQALSYARFLPDSIEDRVRWLTGRALRELLA